MWSWHVYTIMRDTRSSCGGLLTWKAQIHDGGHWVNFDCKLPSSCFVVQYNSLISIIYWRFTTFTIKVSPSVTSVAYLRTVVHVVDKTLVCVWLLTFKFSRCFSRSHWLCKLLMHVHVISWQSQVFVIGRWCQNSWLRFFDNIQTVVIVEVEIIPFLISPLCC